MMELVTKLQRENGQMFRLWNAHNGIVQISKAEYMEVCMNKFHFFIQIHRHKEFWPFNLHLLENGNAVIESKKYD